MDSTALEAKLRELFGADRVGRGVPLARFTTFHVGGPADWFIEPRTADETVAALGAANEAGVPVTVIGGGSNLLVSDAGVRGLVLRPRGGLIALAGERLVRADAAVTINGLVRWTINRQVAGLEAWAGTPGTVGGAVRGNAHYGGHLIGELVEKVLVAGVDGTRRELPPSAMEFGYDCSRLQRTGADAGTLREIARRSLAHRKKTQPLDLASAGCIFQNPGPGDPVPDGIPRSAGALIDRAGLKGHRLGGARVSEVHANFIVNEGGATAADIHALAGMCRDTVLQRFGVLLREEIVRMGEF